MKMERHRQSKERRRGWRVQERGLKRSSQQLISDALCGSRSRSKTGAIDAHKFGALGGGMAEGQIQMLGASLGDLVRPAKNSWGGRGSRDQLAAQNPCRIITLGGLGPLKKNLKWHRTVVQGFCYVVQGFTRNRRSIFSLQHYAFSVDFEYDTATLPEQTWP